MISRYRPSSTPLYSYIQIAAKDHRPLSDGRLKCISSLKALMRDVIPKNFHPDNLRPSLDYATEVDMHLTFIYYPTIVTASVAPLRDLIDL
jgi:hypothetical protein